MPMKSTLPLPAGLVTSSGIGPNLPRRLPWTASTSDAALGLDDRRVPVETGQPAPDLRVFLLVVAEHGEQRGAAFGGQGERGGDGFGHAVAVVVVENDRNQVGQLGVEQRELVALRAGHEDHAGRLVFHQAADEGALLLGELVFGDADVAEEDHVVFGEFFEFFGKLLDVVLAAARAECGVEEQAGKFDAGVA